MSAAAAGPLARPYIDGAWVTPSGGRVVDVVNPATEGMTIAQEEVFGPVVCVIPYADEAEAVALANASRYGLSGSVWGPDAEHAKDVARRIRAGNVAVNQHALDPAGPFGGFKESGIGRENGLEGIEAYTEVRTIPYLP